MWIQAGIFDFNGDLVFAIGIYIRERSALCTPRQSIIQSTDWGPIWSSARGELENVARGAIRQAPAIYSSFDNLA